MSVGAARASPGPVTPLRKGTSSPCCPCCFRGRYLRWGPVVVVDRRGHVVASPRRCTLPPIRSAHLLRLVAAEHACRPRATSTTRSLGPVTIKIGQEHCDLVHRLSTTSSWNADWTALAATFTLKVCWGSIVDGAAPVAPESRPAAGQPSAPDTTPGRSAGGAQTATGRTTPCGASGSSTRRPPCVASRAGSVAVTLGRALDGTLVTSGVDHAGGFGFDQLPHQRAAQRQGRKGQTPVEQPMDVILMCVRPGTHREPRRQLTRRWTPGDQAATRTPPRHGTLTRTGCCNLPGTGMRNAGPAISE